MTPLALALVLVAAFAHAGWNALSKRAPGGAAFVWSQESVGALAMIPVAAAGIWLDDDGRVSLAIVLMGIASGAAHTLYFVLLQRGYETRRPLARLPAGARHGADLGDGRRDRAARRAPGPARARRHRRDRRRRRTAARDARDQPRPRARLRAADGPPDRHLHRLGRPRGARIARGAAVLPPGHQLHDRRCCCCPTPCASATPCGCCCGTTAASSWPSALLSPFAYALVLFATRLAGVAYVAPAREVSILIGAAIGTHYFAERGGWQRIAGAAAIVGGVIALALGCSQRARDEYAGTRARPRRPRGPRCCGRAR